MVRTPCRSLGRLGALCAAQALDMGLKYCLLGNPYGAKEVDRDALMSAPKSFELR